MRRPPTPHAHVVHGTGGNHEFFETPRNSIDPVKPFIPYGVKTIWEPTFGRGALAHVLVEWGFKVVGSDIKPRRSNILKANVAKIDFLEDSPALRAMLAECDMIVFNPPFNQKTEFLTRACELGKPFLFICPVDIVSTPARYNLFKEHHLSIINVPWRTQYTAQNNISFQSQWVLGFHPEYKDRLFFPV
jgi:predicted RNA methylase